jgi:uncharacterized membrane protein YhaH (DUF805 family)
MKWYLNVLKKYVTFSGRARRKEFWMFVLFNIIFGIIASILDNVFGLAKMTTINGIATYNAGVISIIYSVAVLLPSLAVAVRRLHDIGKSGGWIFINLIPLIGSIWYLVLVATAGQAGDNRFGPDPKATAA